MRDSEKSKRRQEIKIQGYDFVLICFQNKNKILVLDNGEKRLIID